MTEGRGKRAPTIQPAFKQSADDTIDVKWSTVALGKVERVFLETWKLMNETRDYLPSVWSLVGPVFEEGVPPRSLFHLKAPLLVSFHPQRSWFWVKSNKRTQKLWLLTFYKTATYEYRLICGSILLRTNMLKDHYEPAPKMKIFLFECTLL